MCDRLTHLCRYVFFLDPTDTSAPHICIATCPTSTAVVTPVTASANHLCLSNSPYVTGA